MAVDGPVLVALQVGSAIFTVLGVLVSLGWLTVSAVVWVTFRVRERGRRR